jgi:anti-anti-sigma regulatory factor
MHPTPYPVRQASGGAAVITMPGQIGDADCGQVHAAVMQAVQSGASIIVADLTGTRSCSYSAAETLVSAQARAAGAGVRVKVAAATGQALLIGQVAGAGHQLDFYPDLEAALAGPRARGTAAGQTAPGRRLRLIRDGAAAGSGQPPGRRQAAPSPAHALPPGPSPAPA